VLGHQRHILSRGRCCEEDPRSVREKEIEDMTDWFLSGADDDSGKSGSRNDVR